MEEACSGFQMVVCDGVVLNVCVENGFYAIVRAPRLFRTWKEQRVPCGKAILLK